MLDATLTPRVQVPRPQVQTPKQFDGENAKFTYKDYIILCVEDTTDWKHATTRNVVMRADPDLTRTVLVTTKLDTKLPQFAEVPFILNESNFLCIRAFLINHSSLLKSTLVYSLMILKNFWSCVSRCAQTFVKFFVLLVQYLCEPEIGDFDLY